MLDQGLIGFFGRDGQDPSDLFQQGRDAVLDKVHKGFDGGQTRIASGGAIASFGL